MRNEQHTARVSRAPGGRGRWDAAACSLPSLLAMPSGVIPPYREADAEGKRRHEDFAALEALTDDLSRENHALLTSVRKHVDVVQGLTEEHSALVQKNNEASAAKERAEARAERAEEALARLGSELGAVVEERDGLAGKVEEAERRANALAAEVVDLEEEILRARADRWADAGGEAAAKELADTKKQLESARSENSLLRGRMEVAHEAHRDLEVELARVLRQHAVELEQARGLGTPKEGAAEIPPAEIPPAESPPAESPPAERPMKTLPPAAAEVGDAEQVQPVRGEGEPSGTTDKAVEGAMERVAQLVAGAAEEAGPGAGASGTEGNAGMDGGSSPAEAHGDLAEVQAPHEPEPEEPGPSGAMASESGASTSASSDAGDREFHYLSDKQKALVAEITELLLDTGQEAMDLAALKYKKDPPPATRPPGRGTRKGVARRFVDWVFLQDKITEDGHPVAKD